MTQAKLTILVIFAHSVYLTLLADEEAEIVATRDTLHLNLVAEWHSDRVTNLLALHSERPGERFTSLTSCQSKIATSSKGTDSKILL